MSGLHFSELARLCNELETISKRTILVQKLVNFLNRCTDEDLIVAVRLLSGEIFSGFRGALNIQWASFYNTILKITNITKTEFFRVLRQTGDIGSAIEKIFEMHPPKKQLTLFSSEKITCRDILDFVNQLALFSGSGSKKKKQDYLSALLSRLSPIEAKCLTKILLGDMRLGVGIGLLEEALAKKFNVPIDKLKRAHMIVGSISYLSKILLAHGNSFIEVVRPEIFKPLKVMLAETAETPEEILKYHGGITSLEYKLDGIRVQIHKKESDVKIFTRRLNEITSYLPEIVSEMQKKPYDFIVDGEIIGIDIRTMRPLAFQNLLHRFKHEKLSTTLLKEIPIKLYLFDLLLLNNDSYIDEPYYFRHEMLYRYFKEFVVPTMITNDPEEIQKFFNKSIKSGHEGIVAKNIF